MEISKMIINKSKDDYRIEQAYKYRGDDYWDWWVWVEASDANLDKISNVIYNLHYTFKIPVRKIDTRENKFRLKTSGWGVFTIYIRLNFKDDSVLDLEHDLELYYPSDENNNS